MARGEASPPRRAPGRRAAGFTYLWLLFFMAFMGVSLSAAGVVWDVEVRREKEAELLRIGEEIALAIAAYHKATPTPDKQFPQRLEDLVEDRRGLVTRRHLRKVYLDPLTGKADWILIPNAGRISGVASRATGAPIRRTGFAVGQESFADAKSYADWRFVAVVQTSGAAAVPEGVRAGGVLPVRSAAPDANTTGTSAPGAANATPVVGEPISTADTSIRTPLASQRSN